MIPRDVLVKMATIGLSAEQAEAVSEMLCMVETATEAIVEKSREKTRARVAKWRESHSSSAKERSVTLPNVTERLTGDRDTRGEDNSLPQKIEPQESKKTTDALRDVEEFKAVLSPLLSEEQVTSLLKIRRKKRAVISGHAATLLLKAIARTNLSVPEAADKCIERSWISIEAEWLPGARGSPRKNELSDAFGTFDARQRGQNEPIDISPNAGVVRYLPARTG